MQKVDGFYQLDKDKQAVQAFQEDVVNKYRPFKTHEERMYWLIENNYYVDFLKMYKMEFIQELTEHIFSFNFEFQSYMAISKFYQSYALKSNDKKSYLETYEERIVSCALFLAQGDCAFAWKLAEAMIKQEYQPATPTFMNAGKARGGEMISCFLLEMGDSLNSINYNLNVAGQLSKIGGGVAISLSNLRSRGESIQDVKGSASGVVPVMKLMEDTFSYVNQLGQRDGAGVANLNIFHWDVEEFLGTKKINSDEKSRLQKLSIGLVVPNKFMELAEKGEDYYVFAPHTIYKEYGIEFNSIDFDEMYDILVENPNVEKRKVNPRELLIEIAKTQFESGYPYITYVDNANSVHALKNIGKIKQSNLCVTGDTRLHTNKGMVTAKELYETQQEIKVSIDKRTKELDHEDKGVELVDAIPVQLTARQANVFKVETQHGYEIKATEWHKFYRQLDNGVIEKVALHELNIGDKLLIQSDEGVYGEFDDTDLAFVAGVINGDGTITNETTKIYLYGDKAILKDKIETMCANIIAKYKKSRTYKHNTSFEPKFIYNEEANRWTLSSTPLFDILKDFGITKETKTRVPDFVFKGTKEVVGAFLSGLYQMDGTVNASCKHKAMSYELKSIDEQGLKEIQVLLANMGVYSSIYKIKMTRSLMPDGKGDYKEYNVKDAYKISIQDRKSRDKFGTLVTFKEVDEIKIKEFNKVLKPTSRTPKHKYLTTITSIEFCGVEDVYDTTQPNYHSLIFNGIVTGNCQEIMQLQETSTINDYGVEDEIKRDINCNLGSLNIVNIMKNKNMEHSVVVAMEALTAVSDLSNIKNACGVKKANDELHSVGLGVMNLHGYLAKNKIMYGSPASLEFVNTFFMMLNFYSIKASSRIAHFKGKSFEGFETTSYADGTYFTKYIQNDYSPKNPKIKELFEGMYIPTQDDWHHLSKQVKEYGMYNAYRLAVAPTQSIGYVQNATPSIAPIVDKVEIRTYGDSTTYYPMPFLDKSNYFFYKSAYEMDMYKYIDLVAEAQQHVDQGISTILYVDSNTSTRELARLYIYAWKKGLKSLYYTRTRNLSITECESCSV